MKKKILSIILALCVVLSVCSMPVMAEEAVLISQMQTKDIITITVDGKYVDCSAYGQMPVIVEGRTLVPLRAVFEALGATVEWNNDTRSVTSVKGDVTISLAVDSTALVVNGETKTIDVPAQIMNDRTMVPVRAVAEAFGCKVEWNNDTRTVVITTAVDENSPEAVVKKAYDAMLKLDFAAGAELYENPEVAMGEFAGMTDIASIIGMYSDAELTEEQVALVEDFTVKIMGLISYEITGSTVNGDVAAVNVTTYTPNFESIDINAYMTEEAIAALYIEVLAEYGYTMEDLYTITDAAEAEKLTNAVTEATFEYVVEVLIEAAADAGTTSVEEVVTLKLKDGKWLIVEDAEKTEEVTVTLYAPDGRTISVLESEVDDYLDLGWYESEYEAINAEEILKANNNSDSNNPTADGYYYRTPSGKKYHLDPNCGGKNSYRTTNISGLSPCSKCAK